MVQNTEFGMPALLTSCVISGGFPIKIGAPRYHFLHSCRSFFNDYFYSIIIAKAITGNKGIGNMLVKTIALSIHDSDATLSVFGVGFVFFPGLGEQSNVSSRKLFSNFYGKC